MWKYSNTTLDSKLNFKKLIKKLSHGLKFNLMNFRHIRNSFTSYAAKLYLNAMLFPYMRYCMPCWSKTNQTTLHPIRSLYGQALGHGQKTKIAPPLQHFSKHSLLNFDNVWRALLSNLCLVYKVINSTAPTPPQNIYFPFQNKEQELQDLRWEETAKFH